jgi:hypothetical protein
MFYWRGCKKEDHSISWQIDELQDFTAISDHTVVLM